MKKTLIVLNLGFFALVASFRAASAEEPFQSSALSPEVQAGMDLLKGRSDEEVKEILKNSGIPEDQWGCYLQGGACRINIEAGAAASTQPTTAPTTTETLTEMPLLDTKFLDEMKHQLPKANFERSLLKKSDLLESFTRKSTPSYDLYRALGGKAHSTKFKGHEAFFFNDLGYPTVAKIYEFKDGGDIFGPMERTEFDRLLIRAAAIDTKNSKLPALSPNAKAVVNDLISKVSKDQSDIASITVKMKDGTSTEYNPQDATATDSATGNVTNLRSPTTQPSRDGGL